MPKLVILYLFNASFFVILSIINVSFWPKCRNKVTSDHFLTKSQVIFDQFEPFTEKCLKFR